MGIYILGMKSLRNSTGKNKQQSKRRLDNLPPGFQRWAEFITDCGIPSQS
jgi:hypothetical protein